MQLLINVSDLEFLIDSFRKEDFWGLFEKAKDRGEYLAKGIHPTGKLSVELSSKDKDKILDALSVLLTSNGLGSDGELNAVGFRIEKLIDQFNVDGSNERL